MKSYFGVSCINLGASGGLNICNSLASKFLTVCAWLKYSFSWLRELWCTSS